MRMILRGQRREFTVPLSAPTVAAALDIARRPPNATVSKRDRLRMRLHDSGRVRCRTVRVYKNTPPYFRGHLRESVDGVVLRGVIRESHSSGFLTAMFAFVTLFMAGVAIACALSHPVVIPGLVICSIGALAVGPLGFALRSQRISTFKHEADELDAKIRKQFGAASSPVAQPPVRGVRGPVADAGGRGHRGGRHAADGA